MTENRTDKLAVCIERLRKGDPKAREILISAAEDRLRRLTRKMLKSFPAVRRWEQTDDVFQNAALRLHRSLAKVELKSVKHFFNLAATNIRRELVDLSRHYAGPEGFAAHHSTDAGPKANSTGKSARIAAPPSPNDPARLASWTEFHLAVDQLPAEEREIFNLLWYEGLPQVEAVETLQEGCQEGADRIHAEVVQGA